MKKMVINYLYLFSINEKGAKCIPFSTGINVITSSKIDGTKKGKSVILKSIYYTLGAECFFEDKWNINDKIFILDFTIDDISYFIFRHQRLFKIYLKENFEEVFKTIHWFELSQFLGDLFGFSVELPNQNDGKMERTPVVFNYLLNFIDQDGMDGSHFSSFKNLGQYPKYKEKVLFYHFNVYNQEYYNIIHEMEFLIEEIKQLDKNKEVNQDILIRVNKNINNNDYSADIDSLKRDLDRIQTRYIGITNNLSKLKKNLIKLRNEDADIVSRLYEIENFIGETERDIKKILHHECPVCHSALNDNLVEVRVQKYNSVEDVLYMKLQLKTTKLELERKIHLEEQKYTDELFELKEYENEMKLNSQEIADILQYKGYIEIRENIIKDLGEITYLLSEKREIYKTYEKQKKVFNKRKDAVNNMYYDLMIDAKNRFGLQEISDDKFLEIGNNFTAGGSNKPISTLIWYISLQKIRRKFNPSAIIFPFVVDSPANVEIDDEKRHELLSYLFEAADNEMQLVVSMLGFDSNDFPQVTFNTVNELENEKYKLLSEEEYATYYEFLQMFLDE